MQNLRETILEMIGNKKSSSLSLSDRLETDKQLRTEKEKLLKKHNCVLDTKRSKEELFFIKHESEENPKGYIGIELEVAKNSGTFTNRKIFRELYNKTSHIELTKKEYDRLTSSAKEGRTYGNEVNEALQDLFPSYIYDRSPIIYAKPHSDGGGKESKMCPITHTAYKHLYEQIEFILKSYTDFGFTDKLSGAGIHANIDFILFGETKEDQAENIKKFLWFLYNTREIMFPFYRREYAGEWYADLDNLLGNTLGLLSEEAVKANFLNLKEEILEALNNNESHSALNLTFNRDGRKALEFRYFSTTTDVKTFLAIIDYSFALTEFCQLYTIDEMDLPYFGKFVADNAENYPFLMEEVTKYEEILSHFVINKIDIPEQIAPRKINPLNKKIPVNVNVKSNRLVKAG